MEQTQIQRFFCENQKNEAGRGKITHGPTKVFWLTLRQAETQQKTICDKGSSHLDVPSGLESNRIHKQLHFLKIHPWKSVGLLGQVFFLFC